MRNQLPAKYPTPIVDDWVVANGTRYDFNKHGWPAWYPTRTLAEWEEARAMGAVRVPQTDRELAPTVDCALEPESAEVISTSRNVKPRFTNSETTTEPISPKRGRFRTVICNAAWRNSKPESAAFAPGLER